MRRFKSKLSIDKVDDSHLEDHSMGEANHIATDPDNLWVFSPSNTLQPETNDHHHAPLKADFPSFTPSIFEDILKDSQTRAVTKEDLERFDFSLSSLKRVKLRLHQAILKEFAYERDTGSLFNFAPIFLGIGVYLYFSASYEPILPIVLLSVFFCCLAALLIKTRTSFYYGLMALTLIFAGMAASQFQVKRAQMPVPANTITSQITGLILSVDQNVRGSPRYLIKPIEIADLPNHALPKRIRVSSAKNSEILSPGNYVTGLARLNPILGPAIPKGYDFSFFAWFKGLGMSGFFMGEPSKIEDPIYIRKHDPNLLSKFEIKINNWRNDVSGRLRAGIEGEAGDLAAALITGDRTGLSNQTQESLRKSGLAHILAISGLHMALVTLTFVWFVRIALALIPNAASKVSIKKWAIGAGFIVATFYLFLSGNGVATQRAWLMITIMLAASLLDRPAITMRNVAIAAFLILLFMPSSLFSPGFQMSFAAVVALVSVYNLWRNYKFKSVKKRFFKAQNIFSNTYRYLMGITATSLIAGSATAIFAAWHFHRIAPLGLFANLLAMPIVSIAVMPLAMLSVLLMPYGLEQITLMPLGKAIEAVVFVAELTNSYDIDFSTGSLNQTTFIGLVLFLALFLMPIGRLKYVAILPAIYSIISLNQKVEIPHMIIAQDGRTIAIASKLLGKSVNPETVEKIIKEEGALTLLYPRRNKFVSDIWLKAYSGNISGKQNSDQIDCDKDKCNFVLAGKNIRIVYDPSLLKQACESADMLIAPRLKYVRCANQYSNAPRILKRQDFETNGTHVFKFEQAEDKAQFTIETAWPAMSIDPTPDHYINDPIRAFKEKATWNEDQSHMLLDIEYPYAKQRRPWLQRYELKLAPKNTKHALLKN